MVKPMNQPGTAQFSAAVAAAEVRLCPKNFGGQKWPVVWFAIKMSFIAKYTYPAGHPACRFLQRREATGWLPP